MDDSNGNGVNFREKIAEWRGQVRQTEKDSTRRFQELDYKIDSVKDELKDFIREELRREKDEVCKVYDNDKKEQRTEISKIKKIVNNIYVKVVALGTSVGLVVGVIIKFILDKVM